MYGSQSNEIITLQIGNYSNFISTHFWNLQESQFCYATNETKSQQVSDVNHDCLFREGQDPLERSFTFTPRSILIDLKENVNLVRTAYSRRVDTAKLKTELLKHHPGMQVYEADRNEPSSFIRDLDNLSVQEQHEHDFNYYNMDDQVKYWSDYARVKYHDRTCVYVEPALATSSSTSHGHRPQKLDAQNNETNNESSDEETSFDAFGMFTDGMSAGRDTSLADTFDESLRRFGEESNGMQGFQLFIDSFNGFGGLASSCCLPLMNEEYPKKTFLSYLGFPHFKQRSKQAQLVRLMNTSLTLKSLMEDNKNMICLPLSLLNSPFSFSNIKNDPIQLDSLKYNYKLDYHTSSILASLIDCITTPYRQKSQSIRMNELVDLFSSSPYKIASLQAMLPFDMKQSAYMLNWLQENSVLDIATWYTPYANKRAIHAELSSKNSSSSVLSACCRGIPDDRVKNIRDTYTFRPVEKAQTILDFYFKESYPQCNSVSYSSSTPMKFKAPYPLHIFDRTNQSSITETKKHELEMPTLTIVQMTKSIVEFLRQFDQHITKRSLSIDFNSFMTNGLLEQDDLDELIDFNKNVLQSFQ